MIIENKYGKWSTSYDEYNPKLRVSTFWMWSVACIYHKPTGEMMVEPLTIRPEFMKDNFGTNDFNVAPFSTIVDAFCREGSLQPEEYSERFLEGLDPNLWMKYRVFMVAYQYGTVLKNDCEAKNWDLDDCTVLFPVEKYDCEDNIIEEKVMSSSSINNAVLNEIWQSFVDSVLQGGMNE